MNLSKTGVSVIALLLASCSNDNAVETSNCINKGIRYFKLIGSYPNLSDGRDSEKVAIQRCNRSTTAFDVFD